MFLFSCAGATIDSLDPVTQDCNGMDNLKECQLLVGWAFGIGYTEMPTGVGGLLGCDLEGSCRNKLVLQAHTENPLQQYGVVSEFGFRFFIRAAPYDHQYGLLEIVAADGEISVPPGSLSTAEAECPGSCTAHLPTDGVQVFSYVMHGHRLMRRSELRHVRRGKELPLLGENKGFDFNKQSFQFANRVILPHDRLLLTCSYDGAGKMETTLGGSAADDEMCLAILFVFPRPQFHVCATSALFPSTGYCGSSLPEARSDSGWEAHDTVTVVANQAFQPLSTDDDLCHLVAYWVAQPFSAIVWPIPLLASAVGMWVVMVLLQLILPKLSHTYVQMPLQHQQNVKVYIVSTIFLTIALGLTLVGAEALLMGEPLISTDSRGQFEVRPTLQVAIFGSTVVGMVTLFELIARAGLDAMLAAHHIITLLAISLIYVSLLRTLNVAYLQIGVLWTLAALSEQPVYIALLRKRFGVAPLTSRRDFCFAAWYTVATKSVVFVVAVIWFFYEGMDKEQEILSWVGNSEWDVAMRFLIPVVIALLYVVQIRQCIVLLKIAGAARKSKVFQDAEVTSTSQDAQVTSMSMSSISSTSSI